MRLDGKAIIVTGGTSGIGRAIVERFIEEGARVLVHGLDRAQGEALVAKHKDHATLHIDDLVDPESPARIAQAARNAFGRIDGIVNNAALVARSTLATTTSEFFTRIMAINARAPLLLSQAALPDLKRSFGSVLGIGSINAYTGEATLLDYSMSKGAMMTMSRNLANAHANDKVRFNHINVGWVLSEREYAHQIELGQARDWHEKVPLAFAPSGRLLKPEEVAAAAVYWIGDESRPVSGSVLELEQYPVIGRNPVKS